jgi:hypothetical protein
MEEARNACRIVARKAYSTNFAEQNEARRIKLN